LICELILAYLAIRNLGPPLPIYDADVQPRFMEGHHMPECKLRPMRRYCLGCWAR
jgi:hypothetical protein